MNVHIIVWKFLHWKMILLGQGNTIDPLALFLAHYTDFTD